MQDSIRRLNDVLLSYANALTDFDQSRFRLLIALGMPAPALIDPQQMPVPCGPPPAEANGPGTPPVANAPGSPPVVTPRGPP